MHGRPSAAAHLSPVGRESDRRACLHKLGLGEPKQVCVLVPHGDPKPQRAGPRRRQFTACSLRQSRTARNICPARASASGSGSQQVLSRRGNRAAQGGRAAQQPGWGGGTEAWARGEALGRLSGRERPWSVRGAASQKASAEVAHRTQQTHAHKGAPAATTAARTPNNPPPLPHPRNSIWRRAQASSRFAPPWRRKSAFQLVEPAASGGQFATAAVATKPPRACPAPLAPTRGAARHAQQIRRSGIQGSCPLWRCQLGRRVGAPCGRRGCDRRRMAAARLSLCVRRCQHGVCNGAGILVTEHRRRVVPLGTCVHHCSAVPPGGHLPYRGSARGQQSSQVSARRDQPPCKRRAAQRSQRGAPGRAARRRPRAGATRDRAGSSPPPQQPGPALALRLAPARISESGPRCAGHWRPIGRRSLRRPAACAGAGRCRATGSDRDGRRLNSPSLLARRPH